MHTDAPLHYSPRGDRIVRGLLIATATLILCSCRAVSTQTPIAQCGDCQDGTCAIPGACGVDGAMAGAGMAAAGAGSGFAGPMPPGPPVYPAPLPYEVMGQWQPPGILPPWPRDEYLFDGGDRGPGVLVAPDWTIYGLELEDTIVHFDTLDGRTLVEPSNRVRLYAPRFGAVRLVTAVEASEQTDQPGGVTMPEIAHLGDEVQEAATSLQRDQAGLQGNAELAGEFGTRQVDGLISQRLMPEAIQDALLPFESFNVIRTGQFVNSEKARLAQAVDAAITWTADQAVQVVIDGQRAVAVTSDQRAQVTYMSEDLRQPKLRLIKVASTQEALPGEYVDFTLRFDNIGQQPLGNIVLVDNLTTRLEYVEGSAQSSREAKFSTEVNQGASLLLRWEFDKPLAPGEGGVARFRCQVR